MVTHSSIQVGAASEVAVELDLLRRGYNVLRPTVPARYDIMAEAAGETYRVQVKTGRIDGRTGVLKASFESPYSPEMCDVIAIHDPDTEVTYYIEASRLVAETQGVTIRFTPSKIEGSSGFMADDCREFPLKAKGDTNE